MSEMVKSRRSIIKANISSISEISFSWKWLIRRGAQHGFNVPSHYLKCLNMIKTFFGLSKVFQKPWNSFRILSSVSMKYSSMRKEKKPFCITKRPREICQHSTDFWIKKNDILRLFEYLKTFRQYCLLPKKQMRSNCSFMHSLCILYAY